MNELLRKILALSATCKQCGLKVTTSEEEISHCVKHALENLECSDKTKKVIELIDHEFRLDNLEEVEYLINTMLEIMDEQVPYQRFEIINTFQITIIKEP